MAFFIKQNIQGDENENLGKLSTISNYHFSVSVNYNSIDSSKLIFYRMEENGEWDKYGEKDIGFELKSVDSFRDYCVYGYDENICVTKFSDLNFESCIEKNGNESFGRSVSFCENFLAVGSPLENNVGVVYIYRHTNGVLDPGSEISIQSDVLDEGQLFGNSISISNDFLVIGANGDRNQRGVVYVYRYNYESDSWDISSKIYSSDGMTGDRFGSKVSLSGDYFVSSSPYFDIKNIDYGDDAGAVYIYKYFNNSWYEVDKKVAFGESVAGSNFGSYLVLKDDYLIIGSVGANSGEGEIDIFYKKRSWGHLLKLVDDDGEQGDNFGYSFNISDGYIVVGSPNKDNNKGFAFIFEDPPVRFRAAQEFLANKVFIPSKVSVKINVIGKCFSDYWALSENYNTVIDATNFSNIIKRDHKLIFKDEVQGFTGNGYMSVLTHPDTLDYSSYGISGLEYILNIKSPNDFSILEYPIRSEKDISYYLWIRGGSFESDRFQVDVLIDGEIVGEINETIDSGEVNSWQWYSVKIIIPDREKHILGLRIKQFGNCIDKIYIDHLYDVPYMYGPSYSFSPYITSHFKIYDKEHDVPSNDLCIYDYKTTIDKILDDDWYNFDSKLIVPKLSESSMHFSKRTYEDIGKEDALGKSFADNLWACSDFETYEQFYEMVGLLTERNPGVLIPLSTSSCIGIRNGEQNDRLFKYYIEESEVREEWWLRDENGEKVAYDSSESKWYLDIRKFDVRQAIISHNLKQAIEYGFNVMQFDNLSFNLSYSSFLNFDVSFYEWTNSCLSFAKEARNSAINNGILSYIDVEVDDIADVPSMIDMFYFHCDGILNKYGYNNINYDTLKLEYDAYEKALIAGKKIFINFNSSENREEVYNWFRPLSINYQNIFAFPKNVEDYDDDMFRTDVLRYSIFEDFYDSYYIVLSTTGGNEDHFLIWENGKSVNKKILSAFRF